MSDRPLFSVGEEVVVLSKLFPSLNGDAVVTQRAYGTTKHILTNEDLTGWKYKINRSIAPADWLGEAVLRKKYKPADQSFHTLLSELTGRVDA